MGRTSRARRRRRKTNNRCVALDHMTDIKNLIIWMKNRGWSPVCKLRPAFFVSTGRGLMTESEIACGDKIMSVPCSLLITTNTVNSSDVGCVFHSTDEKFLAHEILATFLVWEKFLGSDSEWCAYIRTLPSEFSTPLFCSEEEKLFLPSVLSAEVAIQHQLVTDSFKKISNRIWSRKLCCDCKNLTKLLPVLRKTLTESVYMWAWFVVNTRSIFFEVSAINGSSPRINIDGKNCLALAPYLDLFNHSYTAVIDVGINHADNCYDIITKSSYSKYSQVFINYGSHSNVKLCLEYGFVIPCNPNDSITLTLNDLVVSVEDARGVPCKYSSSKYDYMLSHGLLDNLFLNRDGLSFSAKSVIFLLMSAESSKTVYQMVYFSEFTKEDTESILVVGRILVQKKREEYWKMLCNINEKAFEDCSSSFTVAKQLLTELVDVLSMCEMKQV